MKEINHDYWKEHLPDADATNPKLRVAMDQLYGTSRIDFGRIKDGIAVYKNPHDTRTH